jgi:hypothetical protein
LEFPKRVYTVEEVRKARELISKGYKHRLTVKGSEDFKRKVKQARKLLQTAGYYDFLRTNIRNIIEIDGVTQLREADAAIWANRYAVENPVDAASIFVQKMYQMKEYIEGRPYYGGEAERRSVEKRIEFLEVLKKKSRDNDVRKECERLLRSWSESAFL